MEAHQHLRGGLPCDSAIYIRLAGKEFRAALAPKLRDLVAQKHDAILAGLGRPEFRVLAAVADQAAEIVQQMRLRKTSLRRGNAAQKNEARRQTNR